MIPSYGKTSLLWFNCNKAYIFIKEYSRKTSQSGILWFNVNCIAAWRSSAIADKVDSLEIQRIVVAFFD